MAGTDWLAEFLFGCLGDSSLLAETPCSIPSLESTTCKYQLSLPVAGSSNRNVCACFTLFGNGGGTFLDGYILGCPVFVSMCAASIFFPNFQMFACFRAFF